MERNSRHNKRPTPSQIARRQAIGVSLAVVALVGGVKGVSEVWNHSNDGAKAKTELSGNPKEQKAITIGPNGSFLNLPVAVLDIARQNPELNSEDIRLTLGGGLKDQLIKSGIQQNQYDQFHPTEDVTLPVPNEWGVGEPVQSNGGTPEAANP